MTEYNTEEAADGSIKEFREFIHVEQQFVQTEHNLYDALLGWNNIIIHLQESLHDKHHLYELNEEIMMKVYEMTELVQGGMLHDLSLIDEEKRIWQKLKEDVKHRKWKAVKRDIDTAKKEENKVLRLEKEELIHIRSRFADLMKLMKKSNLIHALNEDLIVEKQKHEYERVEEYYFIQIYKFARAYEHIFRHLWKKELILANQFKK